MIQIIQYLLGGLISGIVGKVQILDDALRRRRLRNILDVKEYLSFH